MDNVVREDRTSQRCWPWTGSDQYLDENQTSESRFFKNASFLRPIKQVNETQNSPPAQSSTLQMDDFWSNKFKRERIQTKSRSSQAPSEIWA